MKFTRMGLIMGWVGGLVLAFVPAAFGAVEGQLYGFHPYISLQGEYNDNIFLTENNTKGDFITTVSPGLKYKTMGAGYNFDLDFNLGLNSYASESQNNYISYDGRLNTSYSFDPRWTIRLNEALTRSREGIESYTVTTTTGAQPYTSSSTGGNQYLRNMFEPVLEYKFGEADLVSLLYQNMIYRVEGGTGNDSTGNSINTSLNYWFNIRNGISLAYTYETAQFEFSPNWVGSTVKGEYHYRFNPRTMIFGSYTFTVRNFDFPGNDYSVNSPAVGLEHAFSATLKGQAKLGWFFQVIDTGTPTNGPVLNFSITQQTPRTTYTISFDGGYREDYFTAQNMGFSLYYGVRANVTHRLRERLSVGLTGLLLRDEYKNPDYKNWNWGLTGNLSYQPYKWMTISLGASNNSRESDLSESSYRENRIFLKLTAEY
jgi:hypothetical protein